MVAALVISAIAGCSRPDQRAVRTNNRIVMVGDALSHAEPEQIRSLKTLDDLDRFMAYKDFNEERRTSAVYVRDGWGLPFQFSSATQGAETHIRVASETPVGHGLRQGFTLVLHGDGRVVVEWLNR